MEELEDPKLKKVYCMIKVLKVALPVKIESYVVKKLLLLPDFLAYAKSAVDEFQILFWALTHPYLRRHFLGEDETARKIYGSSASQGEERFCIDEAAWRDHLERNEHQLRVKDGLSYTRDEIPIKLCGKA